MPRIGDEEWSELQDFKHKFKRVDVNVIYILSTVPQTADDPLHGGRIGGFSSDHNQGTKGPHEWSTKRDLVLRRAPLVRT